MELDPHQSPCEAADFGPRTGEHVLAPLPLGGQKGGLDLGPDLWNRFDNPDKTVLLVREVPQHLDDVLPEWLGLLFVRTIWENDVPVVTRPVAKETSALVIVGTEGDTEAIGHDTSFLAEADNRSKPGFEGGKNCQKTDFV